MTAGAARLRSWFDAGTLLRPTVDRECFVDLVRALARLLGFEQFPTSTHVDAICAEIGAADHLVLVLIDGMGTKILDKLPEASFLRRNLRREMRAVFPSTTAAALTTLATGQWPSTHGVPGWWVYLEKHDLIATSLPFTERFERTPLQDLGIDPAEVFPVRGFWDRIDRPALTVIPKPYVGTVFSRYASCGTPTEGYAEIADGFDLVAERLRGARQPTFTYFYIPHVDELAHAHGVAHEDTALLLALLDAHVARLCRLAPPGTRLVVTADHGLVDTRQDRRPILSASDALLSHLACAPSLEATVPAFHVLPGHERAFVDAFTTRLGELYTLVSAAEADAMRLFGPEPLAQVTRERIGNFLGFSDQPTALYYQPPGTQVHPLVGVHASLGPEEMLIPLIVA